MMLRFQACLRDWCRGYTERDLHEAERLLNDWHERGADYNSDALSAGVRRAVVRLRAADGDW